MTTIRGIYYARGFSGTEAVMRSNRKDGIFVGYNLTRFVEGLDDSLQKYRPTFTPVSGSTFDINNLTKDGWYIITIDTRYTDRGAQGQRLSERSKTSTDEDVVWLTGTAADRYTTFDAGGGRDTYQISESFFRAVRDRDTATRITISDDGENVFHFRDNVVISRVSITAKGSFQIYFGGTDHADLVIQKAAAAKFIIGTDAFIGDQRAREYLELSAQQFLSYVGYTDGSALASPKTIAPLTNTGGTPSRYAGIIIYEFESNNLARYINSAFQFAVDPGALNVYDNLPRNGSGNLVDAAGNSFNAWVYITNGTQDGQYAFTKLFSSKPGTDNPDSIWIFDNFANVSSPVVNGAGDKDEYVITKEFSDEVNRYTTDTTTNVRIDDTGVNVIRFRDGVKISSADYNSSTRELKLSFGQNPHKSMTIKDAGDDKFKIGDNSDDELSLTQFLNLIAGATTSAPFVVETYPGGIIPLSIQIYTPPIRHFILYHHQGAAANLLAQARDISGDVETGSYLNNSGSGISAGNWYYIAYDPLTGDGEVESLGGNNTRSGDLVEEVWLGSEVASRGSATSISAGNGRDKYIITPGFTEHAKVSGAASPKTEVTITDESAGGNLYRFHTGVKISSAELNNGVLEISFGASNHKALKIQSPNTGTYRIGTTSNVALNRKEFEALIRGAEASTSNPYTIPGDFMEDHRPDTGRAIIEQNDPTDGETALSINYTTDAQVKTAYGALKVTDATQDQLATFTHTGGDTIFGEFDYLDDRTIFATKNGNWTYTLDMDSHAIVRLADQTAREIITFSATDNDGEINTRQIEITITVTGEAEQNATIVDRSEGKASTLIYGVHFENAAVGRAGNNIRIHVKQATSGENRVEKSGSVYTIWLKAGTIIAPELLQDLWNADSTRSNAITATIVDSTLVQAQINQVLGRYKFFGGENSSSVTAADDKQVDLNWGAADITANNALKASGRFGINDTDGTVTVVASEGRYGTFSIPENQSSNNYDWTYTLDHESNIETFTLSGIGTGGNIARTFYDIITIKVTDTGTGGLTYDRVTYHHLPIAIEATGGNNAGFFVIDDVIYKNGSMSDSGITLTENEAYVRQAIQQVILRNKNGSVVTDLARISLEDIDSNLGFYYDPLTQKLAFTGMLDFEDLTDRDANTPGKQYLVDISVRDVGGTFINHSIAVTIGNVFEPPEPIVSLPIIPLTAFVGHAWSWTAPEFISPEGRDVTGYAARKVSGESTTALPTWLDFDAATRTFSIAEGATDSDDIAEIAIALEVSTTDADDMAVKHIVHIPLDVTPVFTPDPLPPNALAAGGRVFNADGEDIFVVTAVNKGITGNDITVSFIADASIPTSAVEFDIVGGTSVIARYDVNKRASVASFLEDAAADAALSNLVIFTKAEGVDDDRLLSDANIITEGAVAPAEERVVNVAARANTLTAGGLTFTEKKAATSPLRVAVRENTNVAAETVSISFEPDLGAQLLLTIPTSADDYPTLAVVKAAIEASNANDYFTIELADGKTGTDKISTFGEFTGSELTGGRDAGTETLPAVAFNPGAAVQLSGGSGDEIEDVAASITAGGLVFTYKLPGEDGNGVEIFMGDGANPVPATGTVRVNWLADLNRLTIALAPIDPNTGSVRPTLATVIAAIEANEEANELLSVELAEGSSGDDRAVAIGDLPGFDSSVVRLSGGVGETPMATHASVEARGLIFTAVEPGTAGNGIEITHVFQRNSNEPDIKFDDSEGRKIIFNTVKDPNSDFYPTLGYLMNLIRSHAEINKLINVSLAPGKNRNDRPDGDFINEGTASLAFTTKGGSDLIIGLDKKPFVEIHGVRFIPVEDDHGQMGIKFGRGDANDFTISTSQGFYFVRGPFFLHDKPITPDKIIEAWTGGIKSTDLTRHQKILVEPAPGVPPPTRTFKELRDFVTDVFGGSILFANATVPVVAQLTATDTRPPLLIAGTSGNDTALNVGTHNRALLVDGMGGNDTITLGDTSEEIVYRHLTDGTDVVNGFTLGSDKITFLVTPPAAGESLPSYTALLTSLDTFVRLIYSSSNGGEYTGIIFAFRDSLRVNFTEALDEAALMEAMGLADTTALNAIFHSGSKPTESGNAQLSDPAGVGMLNALLGGDEENTFIRVVDAIPEYETAAVGIVLAYNNSGIIEADTNLETYGYLFANPATTEPVITHNGADTIYGKFTYDTDTNRWTYTLDAHHPQTAALEDDAMETITFTVTDSATGRAYTHDLVIAIEVTGTPSWLGSNDDTEFRDTSPDPLPYLEIHGVRFSVLDSNANGTDGIRINLRTPADMDGNAIEIGDSDDLYLITLAAEEGDITAARLKDLWDNLGDGAAARRAVIKTDLITDLDPGATTPPPVPKATLAGDNYFHGKHPTKPMVEVHGVRFTYIGEADLPAGLSIKFKEKEGAEEHGITYKASPGLWSIVLDSAVAATLTPAELVLLWNKGTAAAPTNDGTGGRAARLEQIRASLVDGTIAAAEPEDLEDTGTNSDGVHAFAVPDPATPSPLPTAATVTLDHHDSDHSILQTNGRLTITDTDGIKSVTHNGEAARYGTFSFDEASGIWAYRLNPNDPDTAALTANTMEVITFIVIDNDGNSPTNHDLQIAININGTAEATLTDETVFKESDSTGAPARKPPAVIIHGVEFTIQGADPADGYALKVNTNAVASKISLGADGIYVINLKNDNAAVTANTLKNLWDTDATSDAATRTGLIKATILNDATEDATAASLKAGKAGEGSASGTYAFTPAPAHYVVLSLDNSDDNVLKASGRLTITDTDGAASVTHDGSAPARYGDFTFDEDTGAWEYTLNLRSPRIGQITERGRIEETITFTVTDAASPANTATYELDIGINVVADGAPGIPGGSLEDVTVDEGVMLDYTIDEFNHINKANVTLTYTVTAVGTKPAWLTIGAAGTDAAARTLTIAEGATDDADVGEVMLTVSVSDGTNTTIAPLKLIIQNVNEAPTSVNTTIAVAATEGEAAVTIPADSFTFTDPDGDDFHAIIITEGADHGILLLGDKVLIPGAEAGENNMVSFADLTAGNLKFEVLPSAPEGTDTDIFKFKVADAGGHESVDAYEASINITGVDTDIIMQVTPTPIQFIFGTSVTLTDDHLSIADPDTEGVDTDAAIFTVASITGGEIQVGGEEVTTFTQAQVKAGDVTLVAEKIGSFSVTGRFGTGSGAKTFNTAQEISFTTDSTVFEDKVSTSRKRTTLDHNDPDNNVFERSETLTITDTDGLMPGNVSASDGQYGRFTLTPAGNVATTGDYTWTYELNPNADITRNLSPSSSGHDEDITITATDDAGNAATFILPLKVRVVGEFNIAPVFTGGARVEADPVPENSDLTTWSYTATATDQNSGDTITYTLEGNGAEPFEVDENGVVTFKDRAKVDFEMESRYTFTIIADDGRGGTAQQEISVTIIDENDFATEIMLNNTGRTLEAATDTTAATRLAIITITDLDGDPFGTLEVVDAQGATSELIGVSTDNTELQLKAGVTITPDTMTTVTLRLAENHSVSVNYTLTIAEAGVTNTPAEITPSAGPHAVTIDYDDTNSSMPEATGTITITDEDGLLGVGDAVPVTASGALYGTFNITQDAGDPTLYSWIYTFDEDTPASITLGAGTATENITITVLDDKGFASTHALMINVTVSGNIPPRANPNTGISVAEEDTYTFTEGDFGFSDSDADTLTHITITALPDARDGVLKLNGVAVSAGDMITAAQLRREPPANSDPTDPQPTGLVFAPVQTRDTTFIAGFTYTVSDGKADSPEATMNITVSALDAPVVLNLRDNIGVDAGVAHIFGRHQINVTDPDSEQPDPSEITFNLTAITGGAIERYVAGSWVPTTGASNFFTQEDINNGHVRLTATGSGSLTITATHTPEDGNRAELEAQTMTFTLRETEEINGKEIGYAGGDERRLDLGDEKTHKSITTGLGATKIKPGSGDDKVDPGLGDDEVDLSAGGDDIMIYRYRTVKSETGALVATIAWDGGDTIRSFAPGEDKLFLLDIDNGRSAGNGGGGTGDNNGNGGDPANPATLNNPSSFIDGLGTGFIATLATSYRGGNGGSNAGRDALTNYNITGIEIHFSQAVVLPGGVLGGSILSITFQTPIAWDDFNTRWFDGNAGRGADSPFNTTTLQFIDNDAGKAALRAILNLNDIESEVPPSVAVGSPDADTIDLTDELGQWIAFGGTGDDTLTLGIQRTQSGAGQVAAEQVDEVIYRLTHGTDADNNTVITASDGNDTIHNFALGTDILTFVLIDADADANAGTPTPLTPSAVLDIFAGVSLRFEPNQGGDFTYQAIIFTLTPDDPATTGTDETTTLTLNFKLGVEATPATGNTLEIPGIDGTDLTNADLMKLLGLADAKAAVGTLFADATEAAPRPDGAATSGIPLAAGTYALSDAGIDMIAGIFGDAPLTTSATLPMELL